MSLASEKTIGNERREGVPGKIHREYQLFLQQGIMEDSTDLDDSERGPNDWVKQFSFLFWDVTIDNGSYEEFIQTGYRFAGYSQTSTYSKALWVLLNVASIVLLLVGSTLFVVIGVESQFGDAEAFGVFFLLFALAYSYLFYRLTFVQPRNWRR